MKFPGVETTILLADAKRGIRYASFEDFWSRRLADRQIFFPKDCQGPVRAVQDAVRKNARECWDQFAQVHPELILPTLTGAVADCSGLSQAGEAHQPPVPDTRSSEPLYE